LTDVSDSSISLNPREVVIQIEGVKAMGINKSKLLILISLFSFFLPVLIIAQLNRSDGWILIDGRLVRGSFRDGYFYERGHYYFHYPKEEKSPYENLQIRPAGEIQVKVKPAYAKVMVDGFSLTPDKGNSYLVGLLTGKHLVVIEADGYKPYQQEVEIQPGQRLVLSVELKK